MSRQVCMYVCVFVYTLQTYQRESVQPSYNTWLSQGHTYMHAYIHTLHTYQPENVQPSCQPRSYIHTHIHTCILHIHTSLRVFNQVITYGSAELMRIFMHVLKHHHEQGDKDLTVTQTQTIPTFLDWNPWQAGMYVCVSVYVCR